MGNLIDEIKARLKYNFLCLFAVDGSCSYGAGRTMSRTKAEERLNLEEEIYKTYKEFKTKGNK